MDIDLKVVIAICVVSAFLVAKLLEPSSKYSSLPPGPKVCCPAVAKKLSLSIWQTAKSLAGKSNTTAVYMADIREMDQAVWRPLHRLARRESASFSRSNPFAEVHTLRLSRERRWVRSLFVSWLSCSSLELAVIVGTYKAANDIMERMSGTTSDRPRSVVAGETMSGKSRHEIHCIRLMRRTGNMRILLIGYNDTWRKLRK